MKAAGLGNLVFREVDIGGIPRGPFAFMSPKWQELFVQSVRRPPGRPKQGCNRVRSAAFPLDIGYSPVYA
jgi:hypothetical protein